MWKAPDVSAGRTARSFGVIRPDGRVGTTELLAHHPLVFCENRNALKLRDALERTLGTRGPSGGLRAIVLVGGTQAARRAPAFPAHASTASGHHP